jgi:hypothetical protein
MAMNAMTELYLKYADEMEQAGYEVIVHECYDAVLIKNKHFKKDLILKDHAGHSFIAEVRRLWHQIADLPLDVAFAGHARRLVL